MLSLAEEPIGPCMAYRDFPAHSWPNRRLGGIHPTGRAQIRESHCTRFFQAEACRLAFSAESFATRAGWDSQ